MHTWTLPLLASLSEYHFWWISSPLCRDLMIRPVTTNVSMQRCISSPYVKENMSQTLILSNVMVPEFFEKRIIVLCEDETLKLTYEKFVWSSFLGHIAGCKFKLRVEAAFHFL